MERLRLLVWELRQLHAEMRVSGSTHDSRLEDIIDRFLADIGADRA